MKQALIKTWGGALLLLLGWLAQPLQAQHRLVQETKSIYQYEKMAGSGKTGPLNALQARLAAGDFKESAVMVRLDLRRMRQDEALILEVEGKQYPVIKDRLWTSPEDPTDYAVIGYLMGDPSLPFHYQHAADGREHLTFQTPQDKYYFTPTGDGWFMQYSYSAEFDARISCPAIGEDFDLGEPEEAPEQEAHHKATGVAVPCKLRTVFLYTDRLANSVSLNQLSSALSQNINFINADILQNGNGRNPVIANLAADNDCIYQIERMALISTVNNPYGSYQEVTCPVLSNGEVMRDQMLDGLAGTGALGWIEDLRKDYAADLVVLLTSNDLYFGNAACTPGEGNLNGIAGGIGVGENAAIIVQRAVGTFIESGGAADPTNMTLIHELGHNLGCRHQGDHYLYQGYCDSTVSVGTTIKMKTIMHTLEGAPCDGGRGERRAVFSHPDNHLEVGGEAAGTYWEKNANQVGNKFDNHTGHFEDWNWGSNNLGYYGDFANNSGLTRFIETPGYVDLHNAGNSGSNSVSIRSAEYIWIRGSFTSSNVFFSAIPSNAPAPSTISFSAKDQIAQLEAAGSAADHLFAASLAPNPAADHSEARFLLSQAAPVSLSIYDLQGQVVAEVLREAVLDAGNQSVPLPIATLSEGMYLVQIVAGDEKETLRLVITH